ncbi:Ger(x)C family spore germination protein [Brevibacillus panacihumi]|uniref:Ger(x)C family spore germination protein n=1 Tax=Brevibacillus panacihumi TaxID=497735 RepID=UPI003D041B9E
MKLNTCIIFLLPLILTGCWSKYEVQNINYATAVGIDFEDSQYILYVQMLDFSTVAKLEGQQKSEHPPIWVGIGKGSSMTEAANDLYNTAQQRMSWGNVSAIIFSEKLLKAEKVNDVLEFINRYREVRYISWLFSTRVPLDETLMTTAFFRLSPKATILHNPEQNYKQRSIIPPIRLHQFVLDSNEKAKTSYMPEIGIRSAQWKENQKPQSMFKYSGIHVYDQDHYYARINIQNLSGLPWLNKRTIRLPVILVNKKNLVAVIVAEKPKYNIKPSVKDNNAYFDVDVEVKATVNELHQNVSENDLSKMAQIEIERQIRHTFQTAFEQNIDIYNLGETLYRKNPHEWKRLASREHHFVLNKQSLRKVNIKVHIAYPQRYKFKESDISR